MTDLPPVLDATCGGRMMWFDKKDPRALFVDNREVEPKMVGKGRSARIFGVKPDRVMDFRKLDLPDDSFNLVVFDPPHMKNNAAGYMSIKYGKLPKDWEPFIRAGFEECWRVTKPGGTLIVKWCEVQITTTKFIEVLGRNPLFGHTTNNRGTTKWLVYLKPEKS